MKKIFVSAFLTLAGTSAMALTGDLPQPPSVPDTPISSITSPSVTSPSVTSPEVIVESPSIVHIEPSHSSLVQQCITAFTDQGYDITYGNRIRLCQNVRNSYGVKAVEAATEARNSIDDSTLSGLTAISNDNSLRCVKALVDQGYDISYGARTSICARTASGNAAATIEAVTEARNGIDDSILSNLILIRTSLGTSCVRAFVDQGYDINYGARASICARSSYNTLGVQALQTATEARNGLDDGTAQSLLRVQTVYGLQCVQILTSNGYDINYGSRAGICARFASSAAIGSLRAIANARNGIDDSTLLQLSRIR